MLKRKYITLKNDWCADDPKERPTVTGVVYFYGDAPSELFYENLAIEEVNMEEGRWLLILANEQWVSDDFEKLERILMEWACDEGYGGTKLFGPIDF